MPKSTLKKIKIILYPICIVLIFVSVWNLWSIRKSTERTTQMYAALAETAHADEEEENIGEDTAGNPILLALKEQNPELAGWITIPNTAIDYPVMQTVEDNDYYLKHDFQGNEDIHGTPFLDTNCKLGVSQNLIIYGHHMKDGTMFQNLMLYKDSAFCEDNPIIYFDTIDRSGIYELLFVMVMSEKDTEEFPYYKCINLTSEETYQGFFKRCSQYACWSSGEMPDYGEELLTLSTCEYSNKNGRLVIVARRVN